MQIAEYFVHGFFASFCNRDAACLHNGRLLAADRSKNNKHVEIGERGEGLPVLAKVFCGWPLKRCMIVILPNAML